MSLPLLVASINRLFAERRLVREIDASLAARAATRRPAAPETKRFERARPMVEQLRASNAPARDPKDT